MAGEFEKFRRNTVVSRGRTVRKRAKNFVKARWCERGDGKFARGLPNPREIARHSREVNWC